MRTLNQLSGLLFPAFKFTIGILIFFTFINAHSDTHQRPLDETLALAEQGKLDAQLSLGRLYSEGKIVSQNYSEARKWYGAAADQDSAKAQYMIAHMYRVGLGVAQDFEEAVKWYQKSAQNGDERAQFSLGFLYSVGLGVDQNSVRALSLVNIAAANGYVDKSNTSRILQKKMTQNEIADARTLTTECFKINLRYCKSIR